MFLKNQFLIEIFKYLLVIGTYLYGVGVVTAPNFHLPKQKFFCSSYKKREYNINMKSRYKYILSNI